MNDASKGRPAEKHDPLAALRQPPFVFYTSSRVFYAIGVTMLQTAMLWQVYEISDSALALGLTGLARLIPSLLFGLVGGAVADSYNRRNIVMVAQIVPLLCGLALAFSTLGGWISVELIYGLVVLMGFAATFEGPARAALLPSIVRPETFANAVAVSSTVQSFAFFTGPAVGGAIIAAAGLGITYAAFVVLAVLSVICMAFVRYQQVEMEKRAMSIEAVKEGIQFVRTNPVLLGAMALDMFAVIFGGVKALMPIYARDIIQTGSFLGLFDMAPEVRFGILNGAFEAGAFLMSTVLLFRKPITRTGRALIWTVAFFGLCTIVFGISRNFYLSLLIYTLAGMSDMLSVVMRSTTIQLATPDALRGRVSAVNQIFIQSSNQVNAIESGFVASLTNATFAVVSGGFGTLLTVAAIRWKLPELYEYEIPVRSAQEEIKAREPAQDEPGPASQASNGALPSEKKTADETPAAG